MAYSEKKKTELFNKIIAKIYEGKSVRQALKEEGKPSHSTFFTWLDSDESKQDHYTRACEYRADSIFDEILTIADDGSSDFKVLPNGETVSDHENIQRSRLRIDARKWALGKMSPKKYSDKPDITNTITVNPFLDLMQTATSEDDE